MLIGEKCLPLLSVRYPQETVIHFLVGIRKESAARKSLTAVAATHHQVQVLFCTPIGKEIQLPRFEKGDYLIYHHTAAYSLSMYSKYNCVMAPPAYCYSINNNSEITVQQIKRKETVEEISTFWDN